VRASAFGSSYNCMSDGPQRPQDDSSTIATPETTTFLLATFAEFYRQELGAEDIYSKRDIPRSGGCRGVLCALLAVSGDHSPDSFLIVTLRNRELNLTRHRFRALAAKHLVLSVIWALCATTIILVADKVGYLPKVIS